MSGATRERILDAAVAVLRDGGTHHATTKRIAEAAGCSEALLYKHFASKTDLFVAVLVERVPLDPARCPGSPPRAAGRGSVHENLRVLARAALAHYEQSVRALAAFRTDPALLARLGDLPERADTAGPVAAYLRAEQALGRVAPGTDVEAVASLLLGACFRQVFFAAFTPRRDTPGDCADRLVAALMPAVQAEASPFSAA
ncbi:TetR/AcrR family transcriptional regulator [Streptomyces sp. NPDC056835]|uniref:TetR/AcrR family transcriptional regulator n=1 Tax=Streptomyces sp. NPDC056835 TaxID=3345956 RepID=UPI0036BCCB3B